MTIAADWDVKHQFKQTNIAMSSASMSDSPVLNDPVGKPVAESVSILK